MPILTAAELNRATVIALAGLGASDEEAQLVAKHLVNADLRGVMSHGVRAVVMYAASVRNGAIRPGTEPAILNDSPSAAFVDGNFGFGQVICSYAMNLAIEKAKRSHVAFIGIVNCNHVGSLADYGLMAADTGQIAVVVANCYDNVAPAGGIKAILGTNPICFVAPNGTDMPIVLDMATSAVAWGAVARVHRTGGTLAEGLIMDAEGNPTTDPARLIEEPVGALLPLGGYKGYGLALMVDILAGALTGTGCGGDIALDAQGVTMLTVAPQFFGDPQDIAGRIVALAQRIKDSPRMPDCDEILMPGEREHRLRVKRLVEGIPFDDEDWDDLNQLAAELGVSI